MERNIVGSKLRKEETKTFTMNTNNLYYKIYQKKNSKELIEVISNPNSDIDTKLIALQILDERQELTAELEVVREELTRKMQKISTNKISRK
jgi:hypothetical protein